MRKHILASAMLSLTVLTASAQTSDRRTSTEPPHSPFTYEALGATPSLRLGKRAAPPAQDAAAARDIEKSDVRSEDRSDTAVATERSRSNRAIKR